MTRSSPVAAAARPEGRGADTPARHCLALVFLLIGLCAEAGAAPDDGKSVLILLPGQPGLPAAVAVANGIRSALVLASPMALSIETEHVDLARHRGRSYERQLRELYRVKYGGRRLDALVVAGNEALSFAVGAREHLWPGTPMIVCAVDDRTLRGFAMPADTTMISIRYDMAGTLALAQRLVPDVRQVAVLGGASAQDQIFHELAFASVREASDRLTAIDLTRLSIGDAMHRLAALPANTIVLVSSFQVDGAGRRLYGTEIVGSLSAAANRPMFSVFGTVLGLGVVGGSMTDFEAVGREAGALALQTLRGEPLPRRATQSRASSVPLFDWRQLERWHLDERRIPPGSRVLFRRASLWEQYRWYVLLTGAVLGAQAALIFGLLVQHRGRRQAQQQLLARTRFELLLERLSASLSTAPPASLDDQIREGLGAIGRFLEIERATVWQASPDGHSLVSTHSWVADGAPPPPASVDLTTYGLVRRVFEEGKELSIESTTELDPENEPSRTALDRVGVRSLAAIPLHIADRRLGLLSFSSLGNRRSWPRELLQQLQPLSEIFANALMHKQAAVELASSEALTAALLTALPGEAAVMDSRGVIMHVNEAWAALVQDADAQARATMAPGGNYLDACRAAVAVPRDTAPALIALVESVLANRHAEGTVEYSTRRNGEDRWREVRVQRLARHEGLAVMYFDVTNRKRTEAEARRHLASAAHTDRVAALAELASSLAHELSQPVTAILSNAQTAVRLLASTPPRIDDVRECLTDVIADDRRAGEVIRRMRDLLKKQDATNQVVFDLNAVAALAIDLVSNEAKLRQVSIDFAAAPAVLPARADPVQIQQVILNLLTNGISAAANAPGERRVSVWTASVEGQLELGVHDSGSGIDESHLARIFEPFFTTKADGLGMGLAISRSIMRAHGGRIEAENAPDGGATFRIRLPTHAAA